MKKKSSTNNEFRDAFPVIQLSYDRKLVKSNLTALPLLNQWNCRKGSKIPKNILEMYPEIEYSMKDETPTECKIVFGDLQIWFDLVPFPQAGYIGLYGYHVEPLVSEMPKQKLRMAS
jgi:hypothetical protein